VRDRVYIETSIPSFYYNNRTDPANVARATWTRRWWDDLRFQFDLYSSVVVLEELQEGNHPFKEEKIKLIEDLPILTRDERIRWTAEVYIRRFAMPADPIADAYHLAFASCYNCNVLLTWNCAHLANLNKVQHIRDINATLGLASPGLTTPMHYFES
jgi:hypothetical protein